MKRGRRRAVAKAHVRATSVGHGTWGGVGVRSGRMVAHRSAASTRLACLLYVAAAAVLLAQLPAACARDWSKVNWDGVEADWTAGDEEDELVTEDELLAREMERRQEQGVDPQEFEGCVRLC